MSTYDGFEFSFDNGLEKTPKQHQSEEIQDVAPGWYANCYLCSRAFEEKYMVRQEYKRTEGKGWAAKVTRYVISFCVWCHHSHLAK